MKCDHEESDGIPRKSTIDRLKRVSVEKCSGKNASYDMKAEEQSAASATVKRKGLISRASIWRRIRHEDVENHSKEELPHETKDPLNAHSQQIGPYYCHNRPPHCCPTVLLAAASSCIVRLPYPGSLAGRLCPTTATIASVEANKKEGEKKKRRRKK
ncbi:unnamed protein product [Citrullus colocynthis]|uniref:Uncharacterized protein n=1 Tax=Citrullus colocynthis TaxID=252529 RepID=A0ABP0XWH8_9ROSI